MKMRVIYIDGLSNEMRSIVTEVKKFDSITGAAIIEAVQNDFCELQAIAPEEDGSSYEVKSLIDNGTETAFIIEARDLVSVFITGIASEEK